MLTARQRDWLRGYWPVVLFLASNIAVFGALEFLYVRSAYLAGILSTPVLATAWVYIIAGSIQSKANGAVSAFESSPRVMRALRGMVRYRYRLTIPQVDPKRDLTLAELDRSNRIFAYCTQRKIPFRLIDTWVVPLRYDFLYEEDLVEVLLAT